MTRTRFGMSNAWAARLRDGQDTGDGAAPLEAVPFGWSPHETDQFTTISTRPAFKERRTAALTGWRQPCAA